MNSSRVQILFHSRRASRLLCVPIFALALLPLPTIGAGHTQDQPPRVVIVGGGPDLENNQVAIESNVRYVARILPRESART
ncbi:MAG TPA: hypothetical protein VGS41_09395, partial [Chthonomonadales bacterium]|nr:hypothetical protein [Chthonomonadales bacterium]